MKKNTAHLSGGLFINKPAGVTSFDVIRMLRQKVGPPMGHSGTLDPFATGLLIILIGHATRLQEELHLLPKTYIAEITLGATSDTDDSTGAIRPGKRLPGKHLVLTAKHQVLRRQALRRPEILAALDQIKSQTSQLPPAYAAIKVKGKKMYEYARAGESVKRTPRPIKIREIILLEYRYPFVKISVTCSTGTYIRSLARDMGEILDVGAYCSALTRTAIGPFELKNAYAPDTLPTDLSQVILPMRELVAHLPQLMCSDGIVAKYKQGMVGECDATIPINTPIALLDQNQALFGIGIRETTESIVKPKKIFL